MDANLRCKIFPGQFSAELAIEGVQADGAKFSLFAPARYVLADEPPTRDHAVEGWIRVAIWEDGGDRLIVRLPRESFEVGQFVTIATSQLQPRRDSIEA